MEVTTKCETCTNTQHLSGSHIIFLFSVVVSFNRIVANNLFSYFKFQNCFHLSKLLY